MVKMNRESPLRYKLAFMAVCIALNAAGYSIAGNFELPFWLDTAGTCVSACVLGPVYGGVTGLFSNVMMGITDTVALVYSLINVALGVIVGLISSKGICRDIFNVICIGIGMGVFTTVCATPLNCIFWDGYINNKWGDALFEMLENYSIAMPLRSLCGQAVVDIPDKALTFTLAYLIVLFLKNSGIYAAADEKAQNSKTEGRQ